MITISAGNVVLLVFLLGVAIYTASYGIWTWKRRNRLGAVMIFLIAVLVVILPIYILVFREA